VGAFALVVDAESAGVNHQIDIIHATCISLYIGLQNCGSGINSVAGCIGAANPFELCYYKDKVMLVVAASFE